MSIISTLKKIQLKQGSILRMSVYT